ncbi:MAG: hypothetical protein AB7G75_02500 [Candidatus Binatia bacterium]
MNTRVVVAGTLFLGLLACGGVPSSVYAQATGTTGTPATPVPGTPTNPMKKLPGAGGSGPVIAAASAIHGNKKTHIYHLATCPGYTKVKEGNLVSFSTEDEAVTAGFHKAKNCPK